jgi:hypothetical protein
MPTDSDPSERLIVPYGVARVTAQNIEHVPSMEIDRAASAPLRLGDGPYRRREVGEEAYGPPEDGDVSIGAARLDILRRLHLRDCDVFDKYLRRWIDLYFAFVAAHAREHSAELQALVRAPNAAFDPLLWGLAALRPLPRAHIPDGAGAFVAVDAALWDGRNLIALVFAGSAKARSTQGLTDPVRLLTIEAPGETAGPEIITEQLGETVTGYWQGLAVPPDPFGPAPFRVGQAATPSF